MLHHNRPARGDAAVARAAAQRYAIGMLTTTIALALALAPNTTTHRTFDVADAEVQTGNRSSHLLAYDSDGEVSAEIIVWLDADEQPRLDVVFPDGLYLRVVDDKVESDDPAGVAARMNAIKNYLDTEQPQAGLGWCVGSIATFAVSAYVASAPGLVGSAVGIVCNCGPLLVEEIEC